MAISAQGQKNTLRETWNNQRLLFQFGFVLWANLRWYSNTIIISIEPIPEPKLKLIPISIPNIQILWMTPRYFSARNPSCKKDLKVGTETLEPSEIESLERSIRERYKHVSERPSLAMFRNLKVH